MLAHPAKSVFSSALTTSRSWFWQLRQLCLQYGLPHPSCWLRSQPNKLEVKTTVKTAVLAYWHAKLSSEAESLSSLRYLETRYLSLNKCHPLFSTCGSSYWDIEKAISSGRGRLESLKRHWTPWNKEGFCTLPECWRTSVSHQGTIEAFLLSCPFLTLTRQFLVTYIQSVITTNSHLAEVISECLKLNEVQFWLDCSVMAPVISSVQIDSDILIRLFEITRNYCFGLYRSRRKLQLEIDMMPK